MATATPPASSSDTSQIAPPPWDLVGCGAILLLRSGGASARAALGASMAFVDYERSGVDPYLELLHVPRFTRSGATVGPTIDRIWVTSQRSVISGRANWGIPKDLAQITREQTGGGVAWEARLGDELLASLTLRGRGPVLPVWKPRWAGRLLQDMQGKRFATPINATGRVRFARVEAVEFGPVFSDLDPAQIRGALIVDHFRMGFHEATISDC